MANSRSVALRVGSAGGALFFLHGLVDGSRSWPFVWPALAGAVAFWLASNHAPRHRMRHGLGVALAAGALAGVIGFLGATAIVFWTARGVAVPAGGRPFVNGAAELGIAVACGVAILAAVVGAAAVVPVRWFQSPRPSAPVA